MTTKLDRDYAKTQIEKAFNAVSSKHKGSALREKQRADAHSANYEFILELTSEDLHAELIEFNDEIYRNNY